MASAVTPEAKPVESLLVFLVIVDLVGQVEKDESCSHLVLPEMVPCLPYSFSFCLDVQMNALRPERKCELRNS